MHSDPQTPQHPRTQGTHSGTEQFSMLTTKSCNLLHCKPCAEVLRRDGEKKSESDEMGLGKLLEKESFRPGFDGSEGREC